MKNSLNTALRSICALCVMCLAVASIGCQRKPIPPGPSVVLVVLDTVRRDTASPGNANVRTNLAPALHGLADESCTFNNAWSTAPWTVPSHASMFTGMLPSQHGCSSDTPELNPAIPTIASELTKHGYATAAFFSNPWLADNATGLLNGFETKAQSPIGGVSRMVSGSGDQGGKQTLKNVEGWLAQHPHKRPFFMFVNFLEAHLPYDPPAHIRESMLPDIDRAEHVSIRWAHEYNAGIIPHAETDWTAIRALYEGDVSHADLLLKQLLDLLKKHGAYEDSVIIVVSDHGENIGEHCLVEHQFSVHETLVAVPLVVRAPGLVPAGTLRSDPVMVSDIFATIADVTGTEIESIPVSSVSLLVDPGSDERPVIGEYAGPPAGLLGLLDSINSEFDSEAFNSSLRTVRQGDLRLTIGSDGRTELHDMRADPAQETNIATLRPGDVIRLRGMLPEIVSPAWDSTGSSSEAIDEETKKQLESLGYVR